MKHLLLNISIILIGCLVACTPSMYKFQELTYPRPVDTRDKPILVQEHKTYEFNGLKVDNEFLGARLSMIEEKEPGLYSVTILPENKPINSSPYYAFRLESDRDQTITVELSYDGYRHRYWPKWSTDQHQWHLVDSNQVELLDSGLICQVTLPLNANTPTFLAAQELSTSEDNLAWSQKLAKNGDVRLSIYGSSRMGKDLIKLDIYNQTPADKETIVIISRQHPPEVTGYMAMQAFVEELLSDSDLANAFRSKYRILVYPMMNPDGVDEGHWRHNTGGVDMNRDWSQYNQAENRALVEDLIHTVKMDKNQVILGLDFHSTWHDIYYTLSDDLVSNIRPFKDVWLEGIDERIEDYHPHDDPSGEGRPVSKTWFFKQFGAEGVTYEIGDDTPRDFITEKGKITAQEMMKLLVLK